MTQVDSSKLKGLWQGISSQLLPRSFETNRQVREFMLKEQKDFEQMHKGCDVVLGKLKSQEDQYNHMMAEVRQKMSKDRNFKGDADNYLKVKDDEIHAKNKSLDSINNQLKESVTQINPKKLADLPYETDPIFEEIFSTLFVVLFKEPRSKYDWKSFRNLGLLHENGEDFLSRLANINFRDLPEEHYKMLQILKADEKFQDLAENSEHNLAMVDLADWLDYVTEGQKITLEKRQCERDYDKIRKDLDVRMGGTLQVKEEFFRETLGDIETYQTTLMNYQGELTNLMLSMKGGVDELTEIQARRRARIQQLNSK